MERGYLWLNIRIDLAAENVDLLNSVKKIIRKPDRKEKFSLHLSVNSCVAKSIEIHLFAICSTLVTKGIL